MVSVRDGRFGGGAAIQNTGNGEMDKLYPFSHQNGAKTLPGEAYKRVYLPEPRSTRRASPRAYAAGFECLVLLVLRRCLLTGNSRQQNFVGCGRLTNLSAGQDWYDWLWEVFGKTGTEDT